MEKQRIDLLVSALCDWAKQRNESINAADARITVLSDIGCCPEFAKKVGSMPVAEIREYYQLYNTQLIGDVK
jgi:hypothetical protein